MTYNYTATPFGMNLNFFRTLSTKVQAFSTDKSLTFLLLGDSLVVTPFDINFHTKTIRGKIFSGDKSLMLLLLGDS